MIRAAQLGMFALAVLTFAAFALFALHMMGARGPAGSLPPPLDFEAFWSGARVALGHGARAAYDNPTIEAYERAHTAMIGPGCLPFYYPPSFLLLCLPLALLPYTAALLAFLGLQAALLWPALKRILGPAWGWLPVLACPGFAMNLFSGQNGGLTASCLAFAMLTLDRNEWAAGAWLGLLGYKPQLAACVPVALLAARRWRAAVAAAGTAMFLAGAATLVLGIGAWRGFLADAPLARTEIETLAIKWPMMQSLYGGLRLAGATASWGYAGQAVVAVIALGVLVWICWRRLGAGPEMAALSVAALLVTPYLYDYDLVVMAPAMAWLARDGGRLALSPAEKIVLLACYLAPLAARALGLTLGVTIGPVLALGLLAAIARRAAA